MFIDKENLPYIINLFNQSKQNKHTVNCSILNLNSSLVILEILKTKENEKVILMKMKLFLSNKKNHLCSIQKEWWLKIKFLNT